MKWPASIALIRHGESEYNALKEKKRKDPEYLEFLKAYNDDYQSPACRKLAHLIWKRYDLGVSDYETPLSALGREQAFKTGAALAQENIPAPDVILVSPYLRTRETWEEMQRGGFKPSANARVIIEDRIREQEHGLSTLYNDWRILHVFHPEQKLLRDRKGPYWYQQPQGESISMVRDRSRNVTTMLIREFQNRHVLLVTHHLTILSFRANYERLTPEEFIDLDENNKPINCGVTRYIGDSAQGTDGRLVLSEYNTKHYD